MTKTSRPIGTVIPARFPGLCRNCREAYDRGQLIRKVADKVWIHDACPNGEPPPLTNGYTTPQRLQLVHAVILLAQARKNRIVDHALIHHFENHAKLKRDIPDCALDKHTAAGKRMGRGAEHFFEEGIKLENESGEDP